MSISYQFGDVDAHGALIRSQAASLEAEHQSIVRDVLAAGDFWGGSGSVACQEFITQLGRNFQVIYEQANSHGQKVQTAGNNMSSTDPPSAAAGPDTSTAAVARTPTVCGPQPFSGYRKDGKKAQHVTRMKPSVHRQVVACASRSSRPHKRQSRNKESFSCLHVL